MSWAPSASIVEASNWVIEDGTSVSIAPTPRPLHVHDLDALEPTRRWNLAGLRGFRLRGLGPVPGFAAGSSCGAWATRTDRAAPPRRPPPRARDPNRATRAERGRTAERARSETPRPRRRGIGGKVIAGMGAFGNLRCATRDRGASGARFCSIPSSVVNRYLPRKRGAGSMLGPRDCPCRPQHIPARRAPLSAARRCALALALLAVLCRRAARRARPPPNRVDEIERWVPAFSVFFDALGQKARRLRHERRRAGPAAAGGLPDERRQLGTGDLCPVAPDFEPACHPRPVAPRKIQPDDAGSDTNVVPLVGASLELMTPRLFEPLLQPRLFVHGDAAAAFGFERNLAGTGAPDEFAPPDPFENFDPRTMSRKSRDRPGHAHQVSRCGRWCLLRRRRRRILVRRVRAPRPDQALVRVPATGDRPDRNRAARGEEGRAVDPERHGLKPEEFRLSRSSSTTRRRCTASARASSSRPTRRTSARS